MSPSFAPVQPFPAGFPIVYNPNAPISPPPYYAAQPMPYVTYPPLYRPPTQHSTVKKVSSIVYINSTTAPAQVSSMATSGDELYVGCYDGAVHVYDTQSGERTRVLPIGQGVISAMACEGDWLLVACSTLRQGQIRAFRIPDFSAIYQLAVDEFGDQAHAGIISGISCMFPHATSAGSDGQIRLWRFDEGKSAWNLSGELASDRGGAHGGAAVTALASAPDEHWVSCSKAGDIKVWSLTDGEVEHIQDAHLGGVCKVLVVVPPDEPWCIVSCGIADGLVKVWQLNPRKSQVLFDSQGRSLVTSLCLIKLPQQAYAFNLVIGLNSAGLYLVNAMSHQRLGWLEGHNRKEVGPLISLCSPGEKLFCATLKGLLYQFALRGPQPNGNSGSSLGLRQQTPSSQLADGLSAPPSPAASGAGAEDA